MLKIKSILGGLLLALLFGFAAWVALAQGPEPSAGEAQLIVHNIGDVLRQPSVITGSAKIFWEYSDGTPDAVHLQGDIGNIQLHHDIKMICGTQVFTQQNPFDIDVETLRYFRTGVYMEVVWEWLNLNPDVPDCEEWSSTYWTFTGNHIERILSDLQLFEPRRVDIIKEGQQPNEEGYYLERQIVIQPVYSLPFLRR